jgi:hypothetical protein
VTNGCAFVVNRKFGNRVIGFYLEIKFSELLEKTFCNSPNLEFFLINPSYFGETNIVVQKVGVYTNIIKNPFYDRQNRQQKVCKNSD